MKFDHFYQLLESHGTIPSKRAAASDLWATLSDQQQSAVYSTIEKKILKGKFVHFDPVKAIRENTPKEKQSGPTNYRGKSEPKDPIFSALYNGEWGMYTQADIDAYHMEVYKK